MTALARGAHRIKVLLVTADIPADYLHRPELERPRHRGRIADSGSTETLVHHTSSEKSIQIHFQHYRSS
jgi:hypothetical protein